MSFVNPNPNTQISKYITYDLPLSRCAAGSMENLDPALCDEEAWSEDVIGVPPLPQGCPRIVENPADPVDPQRYDQILHLSKPATIYNTFRLTGSMLADLANENHYANFKIEFVPKNAVPTTIPTISINDQSLAGHLEGVNQWFIKKFNGTDEELVYTLEKPFTPNDPTLNLQLDVVYNVIVSSQIFVKYNGSERRDIFASFDDSLTIKIAEL